MGTEPITLSVDPETAKAFRELPQPWRDEIAADLGLFVKRVAEGARNRKDPSALFALMDEISARAQANGLTEEILAEILSKE
jgi:hypothetical protein